MIYFTRLQLYPYTSTSYKLKKHKNTLQHYHKHSNNFYYLFICIHFKQMDASLVIHLTIVVYKSPVMYILKIGRQKVIIELIYVHQRINFYIKYRYCLEISIRKIFETNEILSLHIIKIFKNADVYFRSSTSTYVELRHVANINKAIRIQVVCMWSILLDKKCRPNNTYNIRMIVKGYFIRNCHRSREFKLQIIIVNSILIDLSYYHEECTVQLLKITPLIHYDSAMTNFNIIILSHYKDNNTVVYCRSPISTQVEFRRVMTVNTMTRTEYVCTYSILSESKYRISRTYYKEDTGYYIKNAQGSTINYFFFLNYYES